MVGVGAQLFSSPASFSVDWTIVCHPPLSMEFFRQEYWSRFSFPTSGDLHGPRLKSMSPASLELAGRFFTTEPPGKPEIRDSLTYIPPREELGEFLLWGSMG